MLSKEDVIQKNFILKEQLEFSICDHWLKEKQYIRFIQHSSFIIILLILIFAMAYTYSKELFFLMDEHHVF